jgi:hypothetical protein
MKALLRHLAMLQLELEPRLGAPCAFFYLALRRRRALSLLPLLLRARKLLRLYQGSIKIKALLRYSIIAWGAAGAFSKKKKRGSARGVAEGN